MEADEGNAVGWLWRLARGNWEIIFITAYFGCCLMLYLMVKCLRWQFICRERTMIHFFEIFSFNSTLQTSMFMYATLSSCFLNKQSKISYSSATEQEKESRRDQIKGQEHQQELEYIKQANMLAKQKKEKKIQTDALHRKRLRQQSFERSFGFWTRFYNTVTYPITAWKSRYLPLHKELHRREVNHLLSRSGPINGAYLISKSINFRGDFEVC
jgi:hypothetical protein